MPSFVDKSQILSVSGSTSSFCKFKSAATTYVNKLKKLEHNIARAKLLVG
jgi:hypothetical protein